MTGTNAGVSASLSLGAPVLPPAGGALVVPSLRKRRSTRTVHSILSLAAMAVSAPLLAQSTSAPLPRATFNATMDGEFRKIDTNRDGHLNRAEVDAFQQAAIAAQVQARQRTVFVTLDSDRNGQLSLAEFSRVPVNPQRTNPDVLMRFDINRDGKVSLIEHRTATLANFDRLDVDKDGVVSPIEMTGKQ